MRPYFGSGKKEKDTGAAGVATAKNQAPASNQASASDARALLTVKEARTAKAPQFKLS